MITMEMKNENFEDILWSGVAIVPYTNRPVIKSKDSFFAFKASFEMAAIQVDLNSLERIFKVYKSVFHKRIKTVCMIDI